MQINNYLIREKLRSCKNFDDLANKSIEVVRDLLPESTPILFTHIKNKHFTRFLPHCDTPEQKKQFIHKSIEEDFFLESNISILDKKKLSEKKHYFNVNKELTTESVWVFIPFQVRTRVIGFIVAFVKKNEIDKPVIEYLNTVSYQASSLSSYYLIKSLFESLDSVKVHAKDYLDDKYHTDEYLKLVSNSISLNKTGNYAACVVRIFDEDEKRIKNEVYAGDEDVDWDTFMQKQSQKPEHGMFLNAKKNDYFHFNNLGSYEDFCNKNWMFSNKFQSYACRSIKITDKLYGTISVFIRYRYEFHDLDEVYLSLLSKEIAEALFAHSIKDNLRQERNKSLADTNLSIDQYRKIIDIMHITKNELVLAVDSLDESFKQNDVRKVLNKLDRLQHDLDDFLHKYREPTSDSAVYCDINEILYEIIKEERNTYLDYKIDVTFNRSNVDLVKADRNELKSALRNVFENAIKACSYSTNSSKKIEVTTYSEVDDYKIEWAVIQFYDNGIGVRGQYEDKIFQESFSGFPEIGTGKGLYLTHNTIKRLNGEIELTSTVGKFSLFIIKLPLD